MTDKKVSGLSVVTSLEDNDLLSVVDVSDQSMSTSGTNKKITKRDFFNSYETTVQFTPRFLENSGIVPAGIVYTEQSGQVFKRDSLLLVAFCIKWSALNQGNAGIIVSGVPRALNLDNILRFPLQLAYYSSLNFPNGNTLFGYIQSGASDVVIQYSNITAVNTITATDLSSTGEIYGTLLYPNGS